jgi:predicted DNA-binding mobile mystery protein A
MPKRLKDLEIRQLSEKLHRVEPLRGLQPPKGGWLKAIRTALGMPHAYVAKKLNVNVSAAARYEVSEREGSIQIDTLRKAAAALDCVLVYAIVPRTSLHQIRLNRAREVAQRTVGSVAQSMALEAQSIPKDEFNRQVDELAQLILTEHPRSLWQR